MRSRGAALALSVIVLAALLAPPALCDEPDSMLAEIRKHFEWGEYDQILAGASQLLERAAESGDSLVRSDVHKYVGVALFATGQIADAREQFARAFELNQAVGLDKYYVSKEILEFFAATVEEAREDIRAQAERDSLVQAQEEELERTNVVVRDSIVLLTARGNRARGISFAALSCGAAVAAAAYSVHLFARAQERYDEYQAAARIGDLQTYRDSEAEIRRLDFLTVSTAALAAVCAASGTYFLVDTFKANGKAEAPVGVVVAPGPGLAVVVDF